MAVPQMTPLLGLFTAICMTTVMLFVPAAIELSTMWNYRDNQLSFYFLLIKATAIFIIWLLMLVSLSLHLYPFIFLNDKYFHNNSLSDASDHLLIINYHLFFIYLFDIEREFSLLHFHRDIC